MSCAQDLRESLGFGNKPGVTMALSGEEQRPGAQEGGSCRFPLLLLSLCHWKLSDLWKVQRTSGQG